MKTIYDAQTKAELITRINLVEPNAKPLWGKMTAGQMLKHCRMWEDMSQGRLPFKRSFIGRLVGKMVLKKLVSDDRPLTRNTPTSPELIVRTQVDAGEEKAAWIACLQAYGDKPGPGVPHPFFGHVSGENLGILVYKHADHHLRQFNA